MGFRAKLSEPLPPHNGRPTTTVLGFERSPSTSPSRGSFVLALKVPPPPYRVRAHCSSLVCKYAHYAVMWFPLFGFFDCMFDYVVVLLLSLLCCCISCSCYYSCGSCCCVPTLFNYLCTGIAAAAPAVAPPLLLLPCELLLLCIGLTMLRLLLPEFLNNIPHDHA